MVDFLSARISEDEDAARGLLRRAQEHELDCGEPQLLGKRIPGWYDWPRVQQMSARVLAECQAKRRIVSLFSPTRCARLPVNTTKLHFVAARPFEPWRSPMLTTPTSETSGARE